MGGPPDKENEDKINRYTQRHVGMSYKGNQCTHIMMCTHTIEISPVTVSLYTLNYNTINTMEMAQ